MNALYRRETPRPAVGSATSIATVDLMEQTGAWFPEAHLDPETMASLAAAGHTELGLDNVMPLFGVLHESAALGCEVDWGKPDQMPRCIHPPYASITDVVRIPEDLLTHDACAVPLKAISLLKKQLGSEVAVVGKAFGPWTLGYHLFGVQNFLIATIDDPDAVKRVIDRLKEVSVRFALAQIEAGADALCFADHATRDLCSPDAYREFLLDMHREMVERIPCPLILHICGNTADRIPYIRQAGFACFHFDSKVPARTARELAGPDMALMGGTSNLDVIRLGTPETIQADVDEKLSAGIDILGPECAVPLDAPFENMRLMVEMAKRGRR